MSKKRDQWSETESYHEIFIFVSLACCQINRENCTNLFFLIVDEETGKCIEDWSISIYRRWNYENNIASIVCHVENLEDKNLDLEIFRETIDYVLHKLQQGHEYDPMSLCALKIFFPVHKNVCINDFVEILTEFQKSTLLVFTIVPAISLSNSNSYVSICGVRHQ